MRYCKKCVMPDSRPGLRIDDDGVCYPCKHYEVRKKIDWDKRWKELVKLADKYRGCNGDYYDCAVTVSAGKDSYFQTHVFKEKLNMNPLLLSVNNFSWTETGLHNWSNLLNTFGVDALQMSLSPRVCKRMFVKALELMGSPTWYFDMAIYAWPIKTAIQLGIPLVVYGENINYEYGGSLGGKESYSAIDQIKNDVVKPIPWEKWMEGGDVTMKDFAPCTYPSEDQIRRAGLEPIYLSYFIPWSGYRNMEFSRSRGFRTLDDTGEWKRDGFLEQYDQIDTVGYCVHTWFKFPKFGHFRVTDVASIWIREGRMTRDEAVKKVIEEDWKLDRRMLADFLDFTGYKEKDFWKVVDRFANREIIEKRDGNWRLKKNIEKALIAGGEVQPG